MTRHGPALLALSIIAVAGWTYNVNYDTRTALDRLSALRAEIAGQREALQVLRVEWAYLNAPDRLAELVVRHNDTLGLAPLVPETLGIAAAIPYPPREVPDAAPVEPDALIAAGPPSPLAPATAGNPEPETITLAALTRPSGAATPRPSLGVAAADGEPVLAPIPAAVRSPATAVETVPAALEAAIAAALAEVGASPTVGLRPAASSGGTAATRARPGPAILSVAAPGVPMPSARPAAWSRP